MWGVEMGGSSAGDLMRRQDRRTHAGSLAGDRPPQDAGAGARWAGEQTVQEPGEGPGVTGLSGVEEMPHGGAEGLATPALQTLARRRRTSGRPCFAGKEACITGKARGPRRCRGGHSETAGSVSVHLLYSGPPPRALLPLTFLLWLFCS